MHSVYVLLSKMDYKLYIGYSSNLKNRLKEHNSGYVKATKDRRPLKLIYYEMYVDKKDAMHREAYLKAGWGRNYLKKVLKNTLKKR
jgi:putative endonuclease